MNEYDQQATDFLAAFNVTLTIAHADALDQTAPPWADGIPHGIRYRITLERERRMYETSFWGSVHDRENGIAPTDYSVLACLYGGTLTTTADDVYDEMGVVEGWAPSRYEAIAAEQRAVAWVMSDDDAIDAMNAIS